LCRFEQEKEFGNVFGLTLSTPIRETQRINNIFLDFCTPRQ
jgi:hypothetical protein